MTGFGGLAITVDAIKADYAAGRLSAIEAGHRLCVAGFTIEGAVALVLRWPRSTKGGAA
jgi:hypothetical protein